MATDHVTSERMIDAFQRARRHWRRQYATAGMKPLHKPPPPFTIALSREAGTNAEEIAQHLAEKLDWMVYDHELVEHIAQEAHIRTELVESLDEQPARWFQASVELLLKRPEITASGYLESLIHTLVSLAAKGRGIIIGRGAACVLPRKTTLAVHLIAPLEWRIGFLAARTGWDDARARAEIEKGDTQQRRFIQQSFQCHRDDWHHYDLVLNASRFSPEECAALITQALKARSREWEMEQVQAS